MLYGELVKKLILIRILWMFKKTHQFTLWNCYYDFPFRIYRWQFRMRTGADFNFSFSQSLHSAHSQHTKHCRKRCFSACIMIYITLKLGWLVLSLFKSKYCNLQGCPVLINFNPPFKEHQWHQTLTSTVSSQNSCIPLPAIHLTFLFAVKSVLFI